MKSTVEQIALGRGDLFGARQRPVFQRICIFADHSFAGAGRVQQDGVELFRQRWPEDPRVKVRQRTVADAAAADISVQHFYPAGGEFVCQDNALIAHPRRNLGGFRTRCRCHIHHGADLWLGVKQGGYRQHGAGFLDVKQAAEMFSHAAQRQALIFPADPESLFAPRHRRQLPVITRRLAQKIGHADLQGIDANTAAQGLLTVSDELREARLIGQALTH